MVVTSKSIFDGCSSLPPSSDVAKAIGEDGSGVERARCSWTLGGIGLRSELIGEGEPTRLDRFVVPGGVDPDTSPIATAARRRRSSKFDLRGLPFSTGTGGVGALGGGTEPLRCATSDLRRDDSAESASSLEDSGDADRAAWISNEPEREGGWLEWSSCDAASRMG